MRHTGGRHVANLHCPVPPQAFNKACRPIFGRVKYQRFARQLYKCRQFRDFEHSRIVASVGAFAKVAGDMHAEHAVGESVVVPGLKLTDHTFQVRWKFFDQRLIYNCIYAWGLW